MDQANLPEVWLRGPLKEVPALLQPVAHALLQAQEEIKLLMKDFPEDKLWDRPANVASPAFHLQHMVGVLERLFTYAMDEQLSQEQLEYLSLEGKYSESVTLNNLLIKLDQQIDETINLLKRIDEKILTQPRYVGRKKLPSTVLGLIFHSAEHTMRHLGQLIVTVRVLQS